MRVSHNLEGDQILHIEQAHGSSFGIHDGYLIHPVGADESLGFSQWLVFLQRARTFGHRLGCGTIDRFGVVEQQSTQITVGHDAFQDAVIIGQQQCGRTAALAGFTGGPQGGSNGCGGRDRFHALAHTEAKHGSNGSQGGAQSPTGMATREFVGSESTTFGCGQGQGITGRQLQRGGCGGGQIPGARFVGGGVGWGQTQVHAHRFCQWRIVMSGSYQWWVPHRFADAVPSRPLRRCRQNLKSTARHLRDQSVRGRHAPLPRGAKARRQPQTGAGGTDFRAHQSAFAHAGDDQVSLARDQQLHRLRPSEPLGFVGVQPLGQGQHGFAFGSECVQHPFMHGQRISHWSACIVPRRMGFP